MSNRRVAAHADQPDALPTNDPGSAFKAHPAWCEESECSVRPTDGGMHQSRRELIVDQEDPYLATAVCIKQSPLGQPWIVATRVHNGQNGASVRWHRASARAFFGLLGHVLAQLDEADSP